MSDPGLDELVDSILESCADLVLKVGSEPGRLVPNAGVDTSQLNEKIEDYQRRLDAIELEIRRSMP